MVQTQAVPTQLTDDAIGAFTQALRGPVLRPGDDGFDAARRVWNAMIDKTPALIVRCSGVADVIAAVRFAREQDLILAVRGGGHNVAGTSTCAGGLLLDLSAMHSVRVDPAQRTARAQGGATWGDFDHETQALGLATTGGFISTTGVGGLTTGGGLGWLMGRFGLSCDNLLSADVVTAAGELVTASPTEHADLFWGIRGGGGNFGVVTSFEFRVHPVGPIITGGLLLHPFESARDVLRFYREFTATAPDELGSIAVLICAPPAPFVPQELHGAPMAGIAVCYSGPAADAARVLAPLRAYGPPAIDMVGPLPYTVMQQLFNAGNPPGVRHYWKSNFLPELSDAAIDAFVGHYAGVLSPHTAVVVEHVHGAVQRAPGGDTAFAQRGPRFNYVANAAWEQPDQDAAHVKWTRDLWEALRPASAEGVYVNYLDAGEGDARIKAAYGAEKYERLVALKTKYDPTNLFRLNQNIRPRP